MAPIYMSLVIPIFVLFMEKNYQLSFCHNKFTLQDKNSYYNNQNLVVLFEQNIPTQAESLLFLWDQVQLYRSSDLSLNFSIFVLFLNS